MSKIPQDVIDQVLAAHDVAEVVGRYVSLKPAGRAFKALCPFHDEKTPSFTVNPERQTFKCFGCGKGGNVFGFLMEHQGLTFPEAVRALAGERGIKVPDRVGRTDDDGGRVEAVLGALAFAQSFFQKTLASPEGAEARAYLERRGYGAELQRRFGIGCAPPGWDRLSKAAETASIGAKLLEEAGLLSKNEEGRRYDRFRNRITFPIADLRGKVVTFGARALDPNDTPKYLNGPETVVFRKSSVLFALDRARDGIRRANEALLMEGYTDVLMAHVHGFDRAVAGMGTAFTPDQAALLRRFAQRVVLVYDGDEAGRAAAEKALEVLLEKGLEVKVASLPEGRDVDEVLLEEGPEALGRVVDGAQDLLAFKHDQLARRHDPKTPAGRSRIAEGLLAAVLKVSSPIERDQYLREVSRRVGGPETEAVLRREAARRLAPGRPAGAARQAAGASDTALRVERRTQEDQEARLLAAVVMVPDVRAAVFRSVGSEDFTSPVLRRLYNAVLGFEEAGRPYDMRSLAAITAEDSEAAAALASLPDDPTLGETVPSYLQYLERQRARTRASADLRALLESAGEPSVTDDSPEPSEPGSGSVGPA